MKNGWCTVSVMSETTSGFEVPVLIVGVCCTGEVSFDELGITPRCSMAAMTNFTMAAWSIEFVLTDLLMAVWSTAFV